MTVQKYYKLASGQKLPTIALGTWDIPRGRTADVVYNALKTGYRLIDCAVLYGNEKECGDGIMQWLQEDTSNKREDVIYQTKLWNSECGYTNAKAAINNCLNKVKGLGYIDVLLIHSPLCGPAKRLETWKAMQEAVDEGLVKTIGVSNYGTQHIDQLLQWDQLKHKPSINQIEISPWLMRQELADYCVSKGIVVEAYAPLAHGGKIDHPDISKLAKKYGVTNSQILLRWSMQKGHVPLPKTKTISRLATNLDVYSFDISPEDIDLISHPEAYEPTDWECTDAP